MASHKQERRGESDATNVESRLDSIDGSITGLRASCAELHSAIANLDPRAAMLELKAQMTRIETSLAELRVDVPALRSRAQVPLSVEEVSKLLDEQPSAKLVCLGHHRASGLGPGEVFEPRQRFVTTAAMISMIRGRKLQVARAA
jgi:hypothetical protein